MGVPHRWGRILLAALILGAVVTLGIWIVSLRSFTRRQDQNLPNSLPSDITVGEKARSNTVVGTKADLQKDNVAQYEDLNILPDETESAALFEIGLAPGETIEGSEEFINSLLARIPVEVFPETMISQESEQMRILVQDLFVSTLGFMFSGDENALRKSLEQNPELISSPQLKAMISRLLALRSSSPVFKWKKIDAQGCVFRFFAPGEYKIPEGAPSGLAQLLSEKDSSNPRIIQMVCRAVGSDGRTNTFAFCFIRDQNDGIRLEKLEVPKLSASEFSASDAG
jgi:hypothetical protein